MSALYHLLWFNFLICNWALLMRAPCAVAHGIFQDISRRLPNLNKGVWGPYFWF
jgi:hypothetical protein